MLDAANQLLALGTTYFQMELYENSVIHEIHISRITKMVP
jgi:hypothetical protein